MLIFSGSVTPIDKHSIEMISCVTGLWMCYIHEVFCVTVVLPHIGSAEETTRIDMAVLAAKNLVAGLKGQELPAKARLW